MVSRLLFTGLGLLISTSLWAAPRGDRHTFSVNFGLFAPRGLDARVDTDVLLANISFLDFRIEDLNSVTIGADWTYGIGDWLEAGVGIAHYRGTAPSVYADLVDSDGTEIVQDLQLRIVPITATLRFFPLSRHGGLQPYVGAGVAAIAWRYSETGEFVDYSDYSIFRARYLASGTDPGLVILGGARVPIGNRFGLGGEFRYLKGQGNLPADFYGEHIDLGGMSYLVTFNFRF